MSRALWIILLACCGRSRFDEQVDAAIDGPRSSLQVVLGEGNDATTKGVTRDSYIAQCAPTLQFGAASHMHAHGSPTCATVALLRFELGSIAPGSEITAASLHLVTYGVNPSMGQHTLYPVLQDWDEGDADDNGLAGPPNWNERGLGKTWTSAGCGVGSRSATTMGSFTPMLGGGHPIDVTLDVSIVQGWVDDPATNFGMALLNDDVTNTSAFGSHQNMDPLQVPMLHLTVLPP